MRPILRFDKPQTVFRLRSSNYPLSQNYNGYTGAERRRGAQLLRFYVNNGWVLPPKVCSVTGRSGSLRWHNEQYDRPWTAFAVSPRAHFFLHMRYRWPERWRAFLSEEAVDGCWAWSLSLTPVPTTGPRTAVAHVNRLLAKAPHPSWVVIPIDDFFGMP